MAHNKPCIKLLFARFEFFKKTITFFNLIKKNIFFQNKKFQNKNQTFLYKINFFIVILLCFKIKKNFKFELR